MNRIADCIWYSTILLCFYLFSTSFDNRSIIGWFECINVRTWKFTKSVRHQHTLEISPDCTVRKLGTGFRTIHRYAGSRRSP